MVALEHASFTIAGHVGGNADQPDRGRHQSNIGRHVVVHGADTPIDVDLGFVTEDAAHDEKDQERQHQGEEGRERFTHEQLELQP